MQLRQLLPVLLLVLLMAVSMVGCAHHPSSVDLVLALDEVEWGSTDKTAASVMSKHGWTPAGTSRHPQADAIECREFRADVDSQRLEARTSFWRGHLIGAEITCVADSMDSRELQRRIMAFHERTRGEPLARYDTTGTSVYEWPEFAQGVRLIHTREGGVVRYEYNSRLLEILVDHERDPFEELQYRADIVQMMIDDGIEPDHVEFWEQRVSYLKDLVKEIESAEGLIGFQSKPRRACLAPLCRCPWRSEEICRDE